MDVGRGKEGQGARDREVGRVLGEREVGGGGWREGQGEGEVFGRRDQGWLPQQDQDTRL